MNPGLHIRMHRCARGAVLVCVSLVRDEKGRSRWKEWRLESKVIPPSPESLDKRSDINLGGRVETNAARYAHRRPVDLFICFSLKLSARSKSSSIDSFM